MINFSYYLHEKAEESRHNESISYLVAIMGSVFMHGRGLICLSLTPERVEHLQLPMMTTDNISSFGTAFTISIEAKKGVTTGISAADRATTIKAAINPKMGAEDLARPGHVFPLRAKPGGVLQRAGQTEGSVDLARLAGMYPAGVICEIMNDDGTMARVPQLMEFAKKNHMKIVTVKDFIAYRVKKETLVRRVAVTKLPTAYGDEFTAILYANDIDRQSHVALVKGDIKPEDEVMVRVHSECLTLCSPEPGRASEGKTASGCPRESRGLMEEAPRAPCRTRSG